MKPFRPIYLDYHATTPVDLRVAERMLYFMTTAFGNASSIDHEFGDEAEAAVKESTRHVATLVGASSKEIVFTSGATESVNLAIQGHIAALGIQPRPPRIALMTVEHKAIIDTCQALAHAGQVEIVWLPVDNKARIDLNLFDQVCRDGISLACVMAANNEVGTIYPLAEISAIASHHQVPLLCDASQSVGKSPISCAEWGITYLTISGHKFYGPKGIGALVVQRGRNLKPLLFGGGHQRGLRSGTLNVPGIVGLGEACRLRILEMNDDEPVISARRNRLQHFLETGIPGLVINGDCQNRLASNLHVSIPDIPNSVIIARVRSQLAISTGAACSSGVETPSHVLTAMGLSPNVVNGALRISIGKFTTDHEIEQAGQILTTTVAEIREFMTKQL